MAVTEVDPTAATTATSKLLSVRFCPAPQMPVTGLAVVRLMPLSARGCRQRTAISHP